MSTNEDSIKCRLEKGLIKVLSAFNVLNLIQMSRVNDYFKDLITKEIINKKLLNLCKLGQDSKNEILEKFGKSMAKFTIDEINLNNFLDTVMKCCSPARLKDVELKLTEPVTVDLDKIEQSMPFFTNLCELKLEVLECDKGHMFDNFLKRLLVATTNLQKLQLNHVDMGGEWYETNKMENLLELRIIRPCPLANNKLTDFMRSLPNLETFMFKGEKKNTSMASEIGSTLAKFCPKLKHFAHINTSNPKNHDTFGLKRYNFLSSFSQLNCITLTSYTFCGSDLYATLVILAPKNIQDLRIFAHFRTAIAYTGTDSKDIMRSSFADFRSLRKLEVLVQDSPRDTIDLQCDFIMHFATQLQNLDTFSLKSGSTLANANKIIELLPKINKLSISEALFKHLPVEMRKIVRTTQQEMERDDEKRLLKLVVNMEQWKELQVYKDINNLMEVILDPVLEPNAYRRRDDPVLIL